MDGWNIQEGQGSPMFAEDLNFGEAQLLDFS